MYLLYLGEFGHEGAFISTDPNRQHSPIFGIGGILVPDEMWRSLDRGYLDLNRTFFRNEIANSNSRAERWELKGSSLCKPSNQANHRNKRFGVGVLNLLKNHNCSLIAK